MAKKGLGQREGQVCVHVLVRGRRRKVSACEYVWSMKGGVAGRNRQVSSMLIGPRSEKLTLTEDVWRRENKGTRERSRSSGNKCIVITLFKTVPDCLLRSFDREKGQKDGPRGHAPSRTHTYTVAHALPALPKGLNCTKLCCQVSFVWGKKSLVVITGKNNRLFVKFWWIAFICVKPDTLMYVGFMKKRIKCFGSRNTHKVSVIGGVIEVISRL